MKIAQDSQERALFAAARRSVASKRVDKEHLYVDLSGGQLCNRKSVECGGVFFLCSFVCIYKPARRVAVNYVDKDTVRRKVSDFLLLIKLTLPSIRGDSSGIMHIFDETVLWNYDTRIRYDDGRHACMIG